MKTLLMIYGISAILFALLLIHQHIKYAKYHYKSIIKANEYGAYWLRKSRK